MYIDRYNLEEADRLYELQLAPDDVDSEAQAIRPGSLIRMHRAMLLMRTLLYDEGVATIGDFMQMALPLLSAHYQSLRDSVGSDPSEVRARHCTATSSTNKPQSRRFHFVLALYKVVSQDGCSD